MAEIDRPRCRPRTERSQSYVIFRLGGEGYALEVTRVQEVIDLRSVDPGSRRAEVAPRRDQSPGHVVPVYDLRVPFELADRPQAGTGPPAS